MADIKAELSWLQKHERLIIVLAVILFFGWLGNKWLDNSANDAKIKAAITLQQLEDQKQINIQLAATSAADKAQYQAIIDTVTRQNAALANAISSRTTALKAQQEVEKTLPLPQIAERWKNLSNLQDSEITQTATGLEVTDTAARKTVMDLEQVPVLQANLRDQQAISDGLKKEVDKADTLVVSLESQVTGLNSQIEKQDVNCKAQISAVKAEARKSKRNWFLRGVAIGAGIVGAIVIHATL